MTVFWRYWLFQLPGWVILAAVLAAARHYFELSLLAAFGIFAIWLVKDVAFYPVLARHYEPRSGNAPSALVGASGVARQSLTPRGYVSLRGELWLAEVTGGDAVQVGDEVVVESVEGLKLRVKRRPPASR